LQLDLLVPKYKKIGSVSRDFVTEDKTTYDNEQCTKKFKEDDQSGGTMNKINIK